LLYRTSAWGKTSLAIDPRSLGRNFVRIASWRHDMKPKFAAIVRTLQSALARTIIQG